MKTLDIAHLMRVLFLQLGVDCKKIGREKVGSAVQPFLVYQIDCILANLSRSKEKLEEGKLA